jgi:hypothetical protein
MPVVRAADDQWIRDVRECLRRESPETCDDMKGHSVGAARIAH